MAQARFYALSLHGALPILEARGQREDRRRAEERERLKDGEDEAAQDRRQDHGKRYGQRDADAARAQDRRDRKSTRLNSSHTVNSYAVFCRKKKDRATEQTL